VGTCESPIILHYPLKQHYAILMNSKIKSEKGIGCQPYKTLCLAHCEVSYLLPLFDQVIDEVIGKLKARVALSNQKGSCLVMFKQLVESSR
jgi:hypothetical protein